MSVELLYAEDVPVGTRFVFDTHEVSGPEITAFARRWDPLAIHTDEEVATEAFGSLIASGVHTMAIFQRLHVEAFIADAAIIAGLGVDNMRLPSPVRPGDIIGGHSEVIENRLRDDGRAVLRLAGLLHDQDDRVVFTADTAMLIRRRDA